MAVKEAAGSLDQVSELVVRTDLTILSGDDSFTLPMLAVGAQGVVSVIGNLVPRDVMALVQAFETAGSTRHATCTHGCFRFVATCWAWHPIRSRSRQPLRFWAGATASCGCRSVRLTISRTNF